MIRIEGICPPPPWFSNCYLREVLQVYKDVKCPIYETMGRVYILLALVRYERVIVNEQAINNILMTGVSPLKTRAKVLR